MPRQFPRLGRQPLGLVAINQRPARLFGIELHDRLAAETIHRACIDKAVAFVRRALQPLHDLLFALDLPAARRQLAPRRRQIGEQLAIRRQCPIVAIFRVERLPSPAIPFRPLVVVADQPRAVPRGRRAGPDHADHVEAVHFADIHRRRPYPDHVDLHRRMLARLFLDHGLDDALAIRRQMARNDPLPAEPIIVPARQHRSIPAAACHVNPERRQDRRRRLFGPALHRELDPCRRDDLVGVILDAGLEIAVEHLRAERLVERLQRRFIPRTAKVNIVLDPARNEGARLRQDEPIADADLLRPLNRQVAPIGVRCVPAQFAGLGRARVLLVEPRAEIIEQPHPDRARRRVERDDRAGPLAAERRAQPGQDEQHHGTREMLALVEADEVMWSALQLQHVRVMVHADEFEHPSVRKAPAASGAVSAPASTKRQEYLARAVDQRRELVAGPAIDDAALMPLMSDAEEGVAFPATERTT